MIEKLKLPQPFPHNYVDDNVLMAEKINEIIDRLNFQEKLKEQELLRMVQPVHRGGNAAEYQNSTM